jgi:hypothetical protein
MIKTTVYVMEEEGAIKLPSLVQPLWNHLMSNHLLPNLDKSEPNKIFKSILLYLEVLGLKTVDNQSVAGSDSQSTSHS